MSSQQPKITLHHLDRSRSQRIAWLLEELGLPYEVIPYQRTPAGLAPPDLEKVHPLGKSPVLTISHAGDVEGEPLVLAESGFMAQYLCEHEGKLVPKQKWKEGREGEIGGETEEWMRWMYLLHYIEGSFMPVVVISLIMGRLRSTSVPFFLRPITRAVANRFATLWLLPNERKHLSFIDSLLASAPAGGPFLCGAELTAADVLVSFPLLAAPGRFDADDASGAFWRGEGGVKGEFERVFGYLDMLKGREAWKRAESKLGETKKDE